MIKYRFLILSSILLIVNTFLHCQSLVLKAPIDSDPNVKIGVLDNGLTYYICNNHKPANRLFMYLVVKAGSINEDNDQLGLAHFVEHMAFNGTAHFKKNELVNTLEKMGVKFGAEVNAQTGYNETVYNLEIPSDKPELVEKGFLILEDWAHNLSFNEKEIDKEREVINEERRIRSTGNDMVYRKYMSVLLAHSLYLERTPIGSMNIINHCKPEALKQYYNDWYRPDVMAVIIVGDIDSKIAEQKINEHFVLLKNPANERKIKDYIIPDNKEPLIFIIQDQSITSSSIRIYYKHNYEKQSTIQDYRKYLLSNLYIQMLNRRYLEIAQKTDAPFTVAYASNGKFFSNNKEAFSLFANVNGNQIEKSYQTLILENQRIKQYGFTQTELDRQKKNIQKIYATLLKELGKTESESLVKQYLDNFLRGKPVPGIVNESKYINYFLPEIKLEEVNKCFDELITQNNMCFVITAPQNSKIEVPGTALVKDFMKFLYLENLDPYKDIISDKPLLSDKIIGSHIVSRNDNDKFGYSELSFSNGMKVVLKPTDFQNDQILFSAFRLGGVSLFPDTSVLTAKFAPQIVANSGVGKFNQTELEKILSGKLVHLTPFIDDLEEGFNGSSTPEDFETLLQLTYLFFTEPRKDTAAFNSMSSKFNNQIKASKSNSYILFNDTLNKIISQNSPRTITIKTLKRFSKTNLDQVFSIYKERFSDAGGFTFFIVGNFKTDEIIPLIEAYIGALPGTNQIAAFKDIEPKFPDGIKSLILFKGNTNAGLVSIKMKDNFEFSDKNKLCYKIMTDVLGIKLREQMRDNKKEIYTIQVDGDVKTIPKPEYSFSLYWVCAPQNVKRLSKVVFKEIKKMHKQGTDQITLDKVKENLCNERENDISKNEFWMAELKKLYSDNTQLHSLDEYEKIVNDITINDVKNMSLNCLNLNHYVHLILIPDYMKY